VPFLLQLSVMVNLVYKISPIINAKYALLIYHNHFIHDQTSKSDFSQKRGASNIDL